MKLTFRYWSSVFEPFDAPTERVCVIAPDFETARLKILKRGDSRFGKDQYKFRPIEETAAFPGIMIPKDRKIYERHQSRFSKRNERQKSEQLKRRRIKAKLEIQKKNEETEKAHRQLREEQRKKQLEKNRLLNRMFQ